MPLPSVRSLSADRRAHRLGPPVAAAAQPLPLPRRRRRGAALALLAAVTLLHAAVLREALAIDLPRPAAQGGEAERMRRAVVVVRMLAADASAAAGATSGGADGMARSVGVPMAVEAAAGTGGAAGAGAHAGMGAGADAAPGSTVAAVMSPARLHSAVSPSSESPPAPALPSPIVSPSPAEAMPARRPTGAAHGRAAVALGSSDRPPAVAVPASRLPRLRSAAMPPVEAPVEAAVEAPVPAVEVATEPPEAAVEAAAAPMPAPAQTVVAQGADRPRRTGRTSRAARQDAADPVVRTGSPDRDEAANLLDATDRPAADTAPLLLAAASSTDAPASPREMTGTPATAPEAPQVPVYRTRLPPPTLLSYDLRRGMLTGIGSLDWRPQGDRYTARLEGTVVGVRAMVWESRGLLGADGIAPVRYTDERRGRGVQAANFQRALGGGGKITYSGPTDEVPLPRGAQDRLTWLIQLAAVAAADPSRVGPGGRVSMFVSGARADADVWTFAHIGAETLTIGGRNVPTLRLVREPRSAHDTRVDVWLDPARNYLPAKARLSNGQGSDAGEAFELMLRE